MRARTCLLLGVLAIAGCLQGQGPARDEVEADVHAAALPVLDPEHDHFDPALHVGSHGIEPIGYSNGVDDSGDPNAIPGGGHFTELAVTPGRVYLARSSGDGSFGGFSIIDTSEPGAPRMLGAFSGLGGSDLEVSDDGAFVFFGTQRNSVEQIVTQTRQAPAGPRGISVVDVRDPRAPSLVSFFPLAANGPHTLTYHRHLDQQEYLIACTYDLVTDPGTGALLAAVPVTQRVVILRIERSADDAHLVPVGQYQVAELPPAGRLYFPHDATVQVHPFDGRTLLYVAYWDKGMQILDISDPARPTLVSTWSDFSPSGLNAIHLVKAFDNTINGRHVTVTEPEVVSADETGMLFFFDTSDPAAPRKLGHWDLPGDNIVRQLDFSPHNFDTFDAKVAIGHYHAGVWVIDVAGKDGLDVPRSAAFHMPIRPRADSPYPQPFVWGVVEHDGLLYASDWSTGLHILKATAP